MASCIYLRNVVSGAMKLFHPVLFSQKVLLTGSLLSGGRSTWWGLHGQDPAVPSEPLPSLMGHFLWTPRPCITVPKAVWPPLPQGILLSLVPAGKREAPRYDFAVNTLVVRLPVHLPTGEDPWDGPAPWCVQC